LQAQRQFQAIKTSNQEHIAEAKTCITNVYNSPDNASVRNHLSLSPSDVTLQQMSDTTFATPTEIQAIYAVHPQVQACRKSLLNGLAQSEPSLVPILVESYNKNEDDLLVVIQQKMTWGDYVRRVRDRATETQANCISRRSSCRIRVATGASGGNCATSAGG
jgi:hypothetical protein